MEIYEFRGIRIIQADWVPDNQVLLVSPGDTGPLELRKYGVVDALIVRFVKENAPAED